jgi:thiamine-phosphate pyrophosphorylase
MSPARRHSARMEPHASSMGTDMARLYLVTPPLGDAGAVASDLSDALNTVSVAAVLLRLAEDAEEALIERIATLRILIQSNGAALLVDGHAGLVARAQADGAHLTGTDALKAAAASLQPKYIAGCGGLATRHDAMLAGESGADYVMFGEPNGRRPGLDAVLERVAWWTEIFQVPCVGYAANVDEVEALARAGAEFVAVGEAVWRSTASLRAAAERLTAAEPVR